MRATPKNVPHWIDFNKNKAHFYECIELHASRPSGYSSLYLLYVWAWASHLNSPRLRFQDSAMGVTQCLLQGVIIRIKDHDLSRHLEFSCPVLLLLFIVVKVGDLELYWVSFLINSILFHFTRASFYLYPFCRET